MWLMDVYGKFQGFGSLLDVWCCVLLVLGTLYQFFDLILELDCVLECHMGCAMCILYIVHYLLSIQKTRKYFPSKKGVFD
jgi:hypothetical protein